MNDFIIQISNKYQGYTLLLLLNVLLNQLLSQMDYLMLQFFDSDKYRWHHIEPKGFEYYNP
jgi:hypothetical protein